MCEMNKDAQFLSCPKFINFPNCAVLVSLCHFCLYPKSNLPTHPLHFILPALKGSCSTNDPASFPVIALYSSFI